MKFIKLTSKWSIAVTALALGYSAISPFGLFAETHVGESMIYPVFRFYRGGAYASITESTIERILSDKLVGVQGNATERARFTRRLASHLYDLCVENRLDPAFVLSVIQVESSFRVDIVSPAGAIGLMQLMPQTAQIVAKRNPKGHAHGKGIARVSEALRDPFLNLTLGVIYLRELKERYSGLSPYYQLAAYNMGPHRLDKLRARPGFRPEKTLKYYQDIMRGVGDWRHYGFQSFPLALKEGPDVARKKIRSIDPV